MNEWLIQQGIDSPQTGLVVGLLVGCCCRSCWPGSRHGDGAAAEIAR